MNANDAADQFADLFSATYRRFYRRVAVGDYQLSSESIAVLHHLTNTGPLTVTEAAAHLGRSQSAMSEMLDRLEARGLLERMPDQRDRRRTLVWLSDDGQEMLERSQQVLSVEMLAAKLTEFDEGQRQQLIEAMRLLTQVLNQGDRE